MSLVDSGERTEFKTGAIREINEETKGRCDLLPLDVVMHVVSERTIEKDDILEDIAFFVRAHDIHYLYCAAIDFCEKRGWDIYTAMLELSIHFADGAKKYSPNNWRKGLPIHSFIDSGVRHYLKWMRGDTDEPHDRAFLWNMVCCIWTFQNKPEMMDICEEDEQPESQTINNRVVDTVIFDNEDDAEKFLKMLERLVSEYSVITVADYMELIGIRSSDYIDTKWGWDRKSLENRRVEHLDDEREDIGGWIIHMPPAKLVK